MSLRIAYIGSRWDYGDRRRGLSFEETNFRSALEGMGHNVQAYDFMTRFQEIGQRRMNDELARFVAEVDPDIAVFVLFKDEIACETIARLTAAGIRTFNWFCDDHWRFESFSRHYAPAFSLVATTAESALPKYRSIGYENVVMTQWACNRYAYAPRAAELEYDVTFVGQKYGERPKIVKALRRAGYSVRCWGYGWDDGRLGHDEMVEVFGASRINLNLANSWSGPFWRRRPSVGQIKARAFEVTGSGGFLLSERTPHLERYFELEREVSVFDDTAELVERVGYWLSHEDERASACEAGYRRVRNEHTYDHRFREIFDAAGLTDA